MISDDAHGTGLYFDLLDVCSAWMWVALTEDQTGNFATQPRVVFYIFFGPVSIDIDRQSLKSLLSATQAYKTYYNLLQSNVRNLLTVLPVIWF